MISEACKLKNADVINFGSIKEKKLGKVTLVASLNQYTKLIQGVCIKSGDQLEATEVNAQPVCVFDEDYIKAYLANNI